MLSQYAYGKLQSMNGEEYFIHTIPALITSRKCKEIHLDNNSEVEYLPITNIFNNSFYHAIIFYEEPNFRLLPITQISVDGSSCETNPAIIDKLLKKEKNDIFNILLQILSNTSLYSSLPLKAVSRIMIKSEPSQIFYFCLPVQHVQRNMNSKVIANTNNQVSSINPSTNCTKWSNDDHQQLKKLLLLYGYDRWKQIQRSSSTMGGKLDIKPLAQVKAYANSYLRALGLALPEDETNLKIFLQKLIEQNNQQYQEYQPNLKDWEPHIQLPQRAVQYTKRLQLLHRVKMLIRKYREDALRNMNVKDRRKINWDGLLNFIPLGLLFGQRPAVWWAKKHDIDLLLGIYKYGYANYVTIRAAKEYCFAEMEKSQNYQDFPVADNLTRRLKKLINTIVKIQQNQGQIDFQDQAESQEDEKVWTDNEKKVLFNILVEFGVPVGNDNKSNWAQLKDKVKNQIKDFSKTPAQVEKMVSRIRWNCQEIISDEKLKQETQNMNISTMINGPFKITYEYANKFIKNINILEFIRKSILSIEGQNLKMFFKEVDERAQLLQKDHPAFIEMKLDQQLLTHVNKNGLIAFNQMKIPEVKIFARMEWLCQVYRAVKEKLQNIKKKNKTFDDQTKKKKFQITKDKDGNIKFPIIINPSLTLVATGKISSLPNYHSEHNLFPIGYVSIRTHASMFHKGQRAKYRCEILEGENRPIYKVIPEEDPDNPIIKDSSTGCWVYICQKVNNLQQVKKDKVTISGTERFGLLEQNVVRLLQDLPDAEKCAKYKFKKNLPKEAE